MDCDDSVKSVGWFIISFMLNRIVKSFTFADVLALSVF